MKKGVSIIICTYNGKNRLAQTLLHLANQIFECPVEIILVDNASNDGTKEFANHWWEKNGGKSIHYSSFTQSIPGKTYAQEMGYGKAEYEYLLVCDDDNWLCETYVQNAFEIMEADDQIGALGGRSEAVFESEVPVWFNSNSKYFAVSNQGKESGDITDKKGCLYGAGMVIRLSIWNELKNRAFELQLKCVRRGNSLLGGEDTEYSYVLRLLNYKIWYDENLFFNHFMTSDRMRLSYLKRLRKHMTESNFLLSSYLDELYGRQMNRLSFQKKALSKLKRGVVKNGYNLFLGNFEQKETAKYFFRSIGLMLFNYKKYAVTRDSIKLWLPSR